MTGVLQAEWLKLRSVRSTWYVAGVVLVALGLSALWAWNIVNMAESRPADDPLISAVSSVYMVMAIVPTCLGVLGVLTMSAEYANGSIRSTVVAASRRKMFLAKLGVVGAAAVLSGFVTVFVAFGLGKTIVGDRRIEGFTASLSDELPELLSSVAVVVVTALVGLGLATVLRSAAGAIVAVAAILYVLPELVGFLPEPWSERVDALMLPNLPAQIGGGSEAVLAAPVALGLLVAYGALAVGAGAVALKRRDT